MPSSTKTPTTDRTPRTATSSSGSGTATTTPTIRTTPPDLAEALREIGLRSLDDSLDDFIARATTARWSVVQMLEQIVTAERTERARRSVERHLGRAHLGRFKPMCDFDWNWPRAIDREAVERILTLGFIERSDNVVLVAPQGLGKTMIAKNVIHAAVLAGHSALFLTASDLLLDLSKQDTARALERRLRHYASYHVLAVDEIGYLSYDNNAADLLFQIVTRRYEKRPVILTTNLAFSAWDTVFPNAACATALIDRLTHHAEIVSIEGQSYRKREAEERKRSRRNQDGAPNGS
jgi:DNA replication protein DnaC